MLDKLFSKPALTVADAAALSGLSGMTIRRLFEREPGVIILKRPEARFKRSYKSIRIPRYVYERVIGRLANK